MKRWKDSVPTRWRLMHMSLAAWVLLPQSAPKVLTFLKEVTVLLSRSTTTSMGFDLGTFVRTTCADAISHMSAEICVQSGYSADAHH